jgi:hypothetical protein
MRTAVACQAAIWAKSVALKCLSPPHPPQLALPHSSVSRLTP